MEKDGRKTTPVMPLRLERLAGPAVRPIAIEAGESRLLGRGVECDIRLEHDCVSRRHCAIEDVSGQWCMTDEGSRHGTYVNEARLKAGAPMPLRDGDVVRIEPWHLIVRIGAGQGSTVTTLEDEGDAAGRVEVIPLTEQAPIAQRRLEVLIECAAAVAHLEDEKSLAQCVVQSALRGTAFQRAAVLRPVGASGETEVVAEMGLGRRGFATVADAPPVSRSLLRTAARGEVAMLSQADNQTVSLQSIVSFGVHSALCAPIEMGTTLHGYLYLDASEQTVRADQDLATFCRALARLYALALSGIRARELESHRRQLESDLVAAREAQRLIMPSLQGRLGRITYALRSRPGRYVAGDLFDVVPLNHGRVAMFLGDVTGKGVAAGILMTATQSYLHAVLRQCDDPAEALNLVNRHISPRKPANTFVSIWLGVFDPVQGVLSYVDAGHGFWLLRRPGGRPERVPCEGGVFLGADPEYSYQSESVAVATGDRLVLFSDGVIEQSGADGQRFGFQRTVEALAEGTSPPDDVQRLFEAVERFAGGDALADDTTVAAVEFLAE